jgi:prophage regulatory protein
MKTSFRPKQAAEFLGIGSATFWRWAKERADFPKPRRLSARCTVFDQSELIAWRDAHMTKGAAQGGADAGIGEKTVRARTRRTVSLFGRDGLTCTVANVLRWEGLESIEDVRAAYQAGSLDRVPQLGRKRLEEIARWLGE